MLTLSSEKLTSKIPKKQRDLIEQLRDFKFTAGLRNVLEKYKFSDEELEKMWQVVPFAFKLKKGVTI